MLVPARRHDRHQRPERLRDARRRGEALARATRRRRPLRKRRPHAPRPLPEHPDPRRRPLAEPAHARAARSEGINYLDLTGNALVRLENPALFIQSQGADRDPSPTPRGKARVRGPKAARLIRTLVDVRPPYGVRDLAEATGLAPGYVSRLLDALDDDALVERTKRGQVESVDIAGLLRRWAESYELFGSNDAQPYLAARGAEDALGRFPDLPTARTAVTGSFAAVRLSPVAAPALLTVYCSDVNAVANALDLIPADQGANVVLLRPFDPIVWERTDEENGVRYVAPSQAAVDCLTGNGRMPAEGEALIEWLLANEPTLEARLPD